jgi:glycosyltransferase involved in cell wall biosynthesis
MFLYIARTLGDNWPVKTRLVKYCAGMIEHATAAGCRFGPADHGRGHMASADLLVSTSPEPARTATASELTIFIACYNEAPDIVPTIETVRAAVDESGCSCEMIVIDDASTDGSAGAVRAYQAAHPEVALRLKVNQVNQGLARNFIAAAQLGRGYYYKLVCGDNVESKDTLLRILRLRGRADLILPYHEKAEGRSRTRVLLSRLFTRLVNGLSGHSVHYYNGLPLCVRQDVVRWQPRTTGFGFQAELVTGLLDRGCSYREVVVEARERAHGKSRALTLRNFGCVACTLLRIGLRRLRKICRV